MRRLFWFVPALFAFAAVSYAAPLEAPFDHSLWDQFLKKFVDESGQVNYREASQDRELLDKYLRKISRIDIFSFQNEWPREEKLALFLNAYNAGVIRAVLDHYPVRSVQRIPGMWESFSLFVGTKANSLNTIRNDELIGAFRDEKIHTALACGGVSCPELSRDAFTGPEVEGQLFLAARRFVNDAERNRIRPEAGKVRLSRIFKWYENDFTLDFGSPENEFDYSDEQYAVLSFVVHYLDDADTIRTLEEKKHKIKYLPFNWALNESPAA